MKKNEFMDLLITELNHNKVPDSSDIADEYEQHFFFKMNDGYTEEEIAAKLGDPAQLAGQYAVDENQRILKGKGIKAFTVFGLSLAAVAAVLFFILIIAWGVVMALFSLVSMVMAACLISGYEPLLNIVPMPSASSILFGLSLIALSVLSAVGCIYFAAFVRQLLRAYRRFHQNTMAAANAKPGLPSLAPFYSFASRSKRNLRRVALATLLAFAALSILAIIVSMLQADSLQFWHMWDWFK
ncbi:MAG TPA: DUF1700 domain-containing protein [Clostridiaceae bacterium]|nr:DUF1700 domain-containing protein [Clostridiaceae bacterium]